MRVLDLFSGIGGFSLGLERAGMTTMGFCEIDPFCRQVLRKHWPEVWIHDDVRTLCRRTGDNFPEDEDGYVECFIHRGEDFGECSCIGTDQFLDEYGAVDLICGGDPCQANANCRTHGATPISLGDEFLRVVEQLCPRVVLRENSAVVRKDAPWPAERFADALRKLGYNARPFRMRACCAGADHRRERLFVLGVLPDADSAGLQRHVGKIVARANEGGQDTYAARPDRWSATPRICRGADGIPRRVDRLRSLGNSVVPQVVEAIGRAILEVAR